MGIEIHPVDRSRWTDLAALFGPTGAYSGCWCMFWRLPNSEMNANSADDNRAALTSLVAGGAPVGLLGYADGEPVGWCAVAPRADFRRVPRTKDLAPYLGDDSSTWSVTCFYIRKDRRRTGVAGALLDAAVRYAAAGGASAVEAYPSAVGGRSAAQLSTGTVDLYARAGFAVQPGSAGKRVVMRVATGHPADA